MAKTGDIYPGLDRQLSKYWSAWHEFVVGHGLQKFAAQAVATTVSVKVADKAKLFDILQQQASNIEQSHIGTVNGRYIASAVLFEPIGTRPMSLLKILERRAGSDDPLGLDSIDFLVPDTEEAFTVLERNHAIVQKEHNDMHGWVSARFGRDHRVRFEAKFTDHLVLRVAQEEMAVAERQLLAQLPNDR